MKKILLFVISILAFSCIFAISINAFEYEGLYYSVLSGKNVYVNSENRTNCTDSEVIIPEKVYDANGTEYTVTTIGGNSFGMHGSGASGNQYITKVVIPSSVTKIDTSAFEGCSNLKTVVLSENITYIGNDAFQRSGITFAELPAALTSTGYNIFDECKSLKVIDFSKVTKMTHLEDCFVMNCTALEWISLPEGIKSIDGKAFQGCTSMKAVYLPSTLEKINSSDWSGAFGDCTNMYLTSTPIVYAGDNTVIPEKEDIYYMPHSLSTISTGSCGGPFSFCKNLNSVIVFGENFRNASANDGMFKSSGTSTNPLSIVFLGDMTSLCVNSQNQGGARTNYVSYYFMNVADTDITSLDFQNTHSNDSMTDAYLYFCRTGLSYKIRSNGNGHCTLLDTVAPHLTEKVITADAGCESVGYVKSLCFCGAEISSEETPALGHDFEGGEAVIVFGATLYDNASQCVACVRGCGTNGDTTDLGVVIMEKGYSSCDIGGIKSFTRGYFVNTELLKAYEEQKGISVAIGFAFALADNVDTESELGLGDFTVNMELKKPGAELDAENIDYVVRYKTNDYVDLMVLIAGYYSENGAVVFSDMLETVSYNSVAKEGNITVGSDGSVDVSVDIGNLLG